MSPYLDGVDNIMDKCVDVLNNKYGGRGVNNNKNTNTQFNSSHDE